MLLLGQHMAEIFEFPANYSFSKSEEFLQKNEFKLLGNAILQGIYKGYFKVIAHPDRIFRRCLDWNNDMEKLSIEIIQAAIKEDISLEMNLSSAENQLYFKREFLKIVPKSARRVIGLDAHSINDLKQRMKNMQTLLKSFY